ncbi:MAG: acyl-[acyl-carrier-protein] thioesterase [Tannerellaceae bacterium]|jgi:acyl-ACP thioesterase|nr:acyl-[acyl-carrier-protein] thioesterase [Tannerellaceae bacterium]
MLPKTASFSFELESYLCDFNGRATLPLIGTFILQAATNHAQKRGFGFDSMSASGMAWVLSRLSIEMTEYPEHNSCIRVETWVEAVANYFTRRCFRIINSNEITLGHALSIWAAIDLNTRQPVDIPTACPELKDYVETDKSCPISSIARIPPLKEANPADAYIVRYSDIDINRHMNSIKYIEHVLNLFDIEMFNQNQIRKFDINYLAEGIFGDKIELYMQPPAGTSEYLVDSRKGADSVCRSRIIWQTIDPQAIRSASSQQQ